MQREDGLSPEFQLAAPQLGTEYRIYVDVPRENTGPWPAVLILDGDDQFRYAVTAYRRARRAGSVPPLLLVGVGYGASYTKPGNRRLRDYTPSPMKTEPESGGAEAFLGFLTGALWPEIRVRWPVDDGRRGIAGHSLGSLLVLHALFRPQPFFNRALASAPSLWWDNRVILCNARALQETGIPLPARLFLGVGTRDSPSMLADLELFEDELAAHPFPELERVCRRFPDRDHYNVLVDSFETGLAALFGSPARESARAPSA